MPVCCYDVEQFLCNKGVINLVYHARMNNDQPESAFSVEARSANYHRWRSRKDTVAASLIGLGGVSVILAVLLIFFYLLWIAFPLFLPAQSSYQEITEKDNWRGSAPAYLSIEEQQEVGLRVSVEGEAEFFQVKDGASIRKMRLPIERSARLILAAEALEAHGMVAVAQDNGEIRIFQHKYETRFDGGVETRKIIPSLKYPYTEQAIFQLPTGVSAMAFSDRADAFVLAAVNEEGLVRVALAHGDENLQAGEMSPEINIQDTQVDYRATAMAVSGNHRWLYIGDDEGRIHRYQLPALQLDQVIQAGDDPITSMSMLLGGISLLVGDRSGLIRQLFPVRNHGNDFSLKLIRQFESLGSPVIRIIPEQRRKGFLALDADHEIALFNGTAGNLVYRDDSTQIQARALALTPRADGLLLEGRDGRLSLLAIDNKHPEVSFSTLWKKVWYENHDEPKYIWQSSAANGSLEAKLSLTPLMFGTLKAALYAMLFAIPLALMGAAYTAYFMSSGLRQWVKPGIEIMAALPTVILGFVAGLWFAPFLEEHLAGIFMIILILPVGLMFSAWWWHRVEQKAGRQIFSGREVLVQLPVILVLLMIAMVLAEPVQDLFFQGDFRFWLSNTAGVAYDQRNALVVGCAMGFAVIPTVFSIAEDAIFGVPKSLSDGSLALGATPWQCLVRVVLPTASPGIFSALMIGFGRAVGETMIVLMATGNTAIMDWNLFEGMRTLAANIAVELPESAVASSHFRVLFLAALVLFIFTFIVNTGAEVVRQRLREKYSSL